MSLAIMSCCVGMLVDRNRDEVLAALHTESEIATRKLFSYMSVDIASAHNVHQTKISCNSCCAYIARTYLYLSYAYIFI